MDDYRELSKTLSVCPICLEKIPASYNVHPDGHVYLDKDCPSHGHFSTIVWRDNPDFESWTMRSIPYQIEHPISPIIRGCPYDCGLCPDHRQRPCCVLLEVTKRCNLGCPVCYASSNEYSDLDPSLETIHGWFQMLLTAGGPFNIQLSGGEPTVRDDLPEIIRMGKEMGFGFFQLNTNGIRIAHEKGYLESLSEAGLSVVYLQFDGTEDTIYRKIRGQNLYQTKLKVIERCKEVGIGLVLVPTIIPGINDENLGEIIRLAVSNLPIVRCVHFQPISYMGRYEKTPENADRITLPELMRKIEEQTNGLIHIENFKPCSGQHPKCGFQANFIHTEDGFLMPLSKFNPDEISGSCCSLLEDRQNSSQKAQNFVAKTWTLRKLKEEKQSDYKIVSDWDSFLENRQKNHFTISAMAFQDAWNLDLERLKRCYIMIVSPDSRLIPFCAYNLSNRDGETLYRK